MLTKNPKSIKITVELILGKTKKILCEVINAYTPDFIISSTLKWQRTESLVQWKSRKLTDKICTSYPVPVYVVPAKRMFDFERKLAKQFANPISTSEEELSTKNNFIHPKLIHANSEMSPAIISAEQNYSSEDIYSPKLACIVDDKDSVIAEGNDDIDDDNADQLSINSVSSSSSLQTKLHRTARKHRQIMARKIDEITKDLTLDQAKKQLSKLDIVIESSLQFSLELDTMPDLDMETRNANLNNLKSIMKGVSGGAKPMRSMLDVGPLPKLKLKKTSSPISTQHHKSKIQFSANSKKIDENGALGNTKDYSLKPIRSYNEPSSVSTDGRSIHSVSHSSYGETLRKIRSNESTKKSSIRHSNTTSSNTSSNSSGGSRWGLFSLFRGSGSSSTHTKSGRSMSSSGSESENDYIGFRPAPPPNTTKKKSSKTVRAK